MPPGTYYSGDYDPYGDFGLYDVEVVDVEAYRDTLNLKLSTLLEAPDVKDPYDCPREFLALYVGNYCFSKVVVADFNVVFEDDQLAVNIDGLRTLLELFDYGFGGELKKASRLFPQCGKS